MKKSMSKRVYKIAKPHMKTISLIVILSMVINVLELVNPYLIKVVIDDYLSLGLFEKAGITITMIGLIYIFIVILLNGLDLLVRCLTDLVGEKVVFSLRNQLFKFVEYAGIPFHDKMATGKLFVAITNDTEDISALFKDVITTIIKDIIMIIAIVIIMLYINTKLSLLSFIVIPFIILTSLVMSTTLNKLYKYSKSIRTKLSTFIAESIYGLKLIKIFNRNKEKELECEEYEQQFLESRRKPAILEGLLPGIMNIIENIAVAIIIVSCTNHWFGIYLEVGVIYIFITYIKKVFEPIMRIIENIEVIQDAIVSIDKIYEILDQESKLENLEEGKYISKIKGKIEFKNVWFSYDGKNHVLKDVSFIINPYESIALVGKTGSGKTTITNLINRFYDVDKGEILLDGVNVKDINLKSLRKNVGTILQEPFVFARSINDNIKINSNISDKAIDGALKLSSASYFVNKLPGKKEYIAKERGISFSVGQKQLLSFARIFAHNPSIFILDEATANIDTNTEKQIQKSVDLISKDKTSIFIAHRLSTIVNVDKIFVLDKGQIIESGNHNELLKKGGYYSKLYESYYTSLSS